MAPISSDPVEGLKPDDVARRTFTAVRKGYDPIEVQGFLVSVAAELREARTAILELEREVRAARAEAERNKDLDPSRLTTLLGEEMSRVLEAARTAADDLRAKAVAESSQLLAESHAEADRMQAEAAAVLTVKTAEAEAEVALIRSQGDELQVQAQLDAAAEVERGRQEGREMVAEAQKVRERMLQDLARRRKAGRQQIERLQAGRDRLLSAYEVVRETLDQATEELQVALPEARLAAESAALRDEDEATFEELEQEAAALPPTAAERAEQEPPTGEESAEAEPAEVAAAEVAAADEPSLEQPGDERQGRMSSSVNVIRRDEPEPTVEESAEAEAGPDDAEPAEVSSLFARLREETEAAPAADGTEAAGDTVVAVVVEETIEVVDVVVATGDAAEPFELVEEIVVDQVVVEEVVVEETVVEPVEETVEEAVVEEVAVDPDAALVARRDAALVEVERALSRRIKRELSDEQNELLDAVRRQKGKPTVEKVLPGLDAHLGRYREAALAGLAAAAKAGSDLVGGKGAAPKTKVGDLAEALAGELIEPLRDRIENCFREAAGDEEELAERLRACYREWKGQRVEEVTAKAALSASNRGLLDRLAPGTLVHWIVDDGDSPSPDCDDNALAGDLPKGEPFPTGHVTPPISPHCRCLVAPRQG